MARWIAIFDDHPRAISEPIRKRVGQAHLDYLQRHSDKILIGGGLRPAPEEWYCGGLWILNVETHDEAKALVEGDPFFTEGLRLGYRLFVWGKAPIYGSVTL